MDGREAKRIEESNCRRNFEDRLSRKMRFNEKR